MAKERKLFIVVGILLLLFVFIGTKDKFIPIEPVVGNWDISEEVAKQGYEEFLIEEIDFDYSDPQIQELARTIKSNTATPYEAVKTTASYVYNNIRYSSKVSISYCYEETASSALEARSGDCVSMVRANVAILRAMGIPARSNGGCLKSSQRCSPLFAVAPLIDAKVTPMTEDDFKKRGFLHEWAEIWVPTQGWLILEATSGQLFEKNCAAYINYAYDSNQYDRCIISSREFWSLCRAS